MKKLLLLSVLVSSQLFALVGGGLWLNSDLVKFPSGTDESGGFSVENSGFDGAGGIGGFLYIDLPKIPVIGKTSIELESELLVGNNYNLTTYVGDQELATVKFPWLRSSTFLTLRKTAMQVKIPFLAKAQLYYGGGFNSHRSIPLITVDFFEKAFSSELQNSLANINQGNNTTDLQDYIIKNIDKKSGIHLTGGAQLKVLILNIFVNARYTLAKDVIPGKIGFFSLTTGLGVGI